jgi:elongation factor P
MVQIGVQKVSNNMKLEHKNDVWTIVEFHHNKPGKGGAFVRIRMKSLTTGRVNRGELSGSQRIEQTEGQYRSMIFTLPGRARRLSSWTRHHEQVQIEPKMVATAPASSWKTWPS